MKSITRYGRPRKPATVNRELGILSGIFRMAVDYEEITENPCRKVESLPENNQRTRHLSFEEEDRLFAKLTGERDYLGPLVMEPIVREALLELNGQSANAEFVFTNPDTGTRYKDVKKSFSAACREADISNFTFHDLRHTFGTRLADAALTW